MQYNLTPGAGNIPAAPTTTPTSLFRYGETTLWSTQLLVANSALANQSFRLFGTALTQSGQGFASLSIAETNIKIPGQIPQGVGYDVFGVATQVVTTAGTAQTAALNQGTNAQDLINQLINIVHNGVLTWDFTQTNVDICPIELAGGGGGTFGTLAGAGQGTNDFIGNMNNGNGGIWRYGTHPVTLPGQGVFAILVRFGALAATIDAQNGAAVRVILLGKYKNVIEIG